MKCPHCGGLIDVVPAQPEPDCRQSELPFVVGLRLPTNYLKKVIANEEREFHTGAPAAHEHDHVHVFQKSSLEHGHDHEGGRGELTPAQQDLLDQIEELIGNENRAQHFRTTWTLRIREYPNQVFTAIGETRAAKREGKVNRSVGGYLNWHFQQFRENARRQRHVG